MSGSERRSVLVVTPWLPSDVRPEAGIFISRDIELLAQDHDVHVLHLSAEGTSLPIPGAVSLRQIPFLPREPLSILRARRTIRAALAQHDLVHTMAASALLPFMGLRVDVPWVHTEHWSGFIAPETLSAPERLTLPIVVSVMRRPDAVVAVGERLAKVLSDHRAGRESFVIANAVEQPGTLVERRQGSILPLIGVGGIVAGKGPDIAVRTLAELRSRGLDARLTWLGEGPLRREIEQLAHDLGVFEYLTLPGAVERERVSEELALSEVFILPTMRETFGVAIAEALVAGRPVVVGGQGEHESFVAPPDGIVVGERSAGAFANAVQQVLEMNAARTVDQIGEEARRRFREEIRAEAYERVYCEAQEIHDVR